MSNLVKHFVFGMLTSFVPIITLSFYHGRMIKHDLDYALMARWSPLIFGMINMLVFVVAESYGVVDYFLIGAVMSMIYSSFARYHELPEKLLKMENPNYYHVLSLVIWGIVYGVGMDYLYKNIH